MGYCEYKKIPQIKLCRGDLKHLVDIQSRTIQEPDFNSVEATEVFDTVRRQWCAIETISGRINQGVSRFSKIHILEETTHIFWTMWDIDLPEIETKNTWVLYNDTRYKILRLDNINELNSAIAIQTTERGDSTLGASEA